MTFRQKCVQLATIVAVVLCHRLSAHAQSSRADVEWKNAEGLLKAGNYAEAKRHYVVALDLDRADASQRRRVLNALNSLGWIENELGNFEAATKWFEQAVPVAGELKDNGALAAVLSNLGAAQKSLGQYDAASRSYTAALSRSRAAKDRRTETAVLQNLGALHFALGDFAKAVDAYGDALAVSRQAKDASFETELLNERGAVYEALHRPEAALENYRDALALARRSGDVQLESDALNNLGTVSLALGRLDDGLRWLEQALVAAGKAGDANGEAITLNNLGAAHVASGKLEEADANLERSLGLSMRTKNIAAQADALSNLMLLAKARQSSRAAIWFGKQAVNLYQQQRAQSQSFSERTKRVFTHIKQDAYRTLAELLIVNGRISEAIEVLDLIKEAEIAEFLRRSENATMIEFTDAENEFTTRREPLVRYGARFRELESKTSRSIAEESELRELEAKLTLANREYATALVRLEKAAPGKSESFKSFEGLAGSLAETGTGTVLVATLVANEKIYAALVTSDATVWSERTIAEAELNGKIVAFQRELRHPSGNPLPFARELYDLLLRPFATNLTGVQTILWSLDRSLRYLPTAALHDGEKFLVESCRQVLITRSQIHAMRDAAKRSWRALGLGVSDATEDFPALPGVVEELHGVVRERSGDGIFPGQIKLNSDFTRSTMLDALRSSDSRSAFSLVHIATHFKLASACERSVLVLGRGERLSLQDFETQPSLRNVFHGTELLTLSACDTAAGGVCDGVEFDALSDLAQRRGAKAVVATLWPVADRSTARFMRKFYEACERTSISKAEALREAQMAMLRGELDDKNFSSQSRGSVLATAPRGKTDGQFAHPYFWSPFVLIGNWQ